MTLEQTTATVSCTRLDRRAHRPAHRPAGAGQPERTSGRARPAGLLRRARHVAAHRLYWEAPNGLILAGVGARAEFTAAGPDRFAGIAAAWQALRDEVRVRVRVQIRNSSNHATRTTQRAAGPMLLGGFAFDPEWPRTTTWTGFPAGLLILPRFLLACTPRGAS